MKKTYKFLVKNLPFILFGTLATSILGVVALYLGYNSITSRLKLDGACTIIFAILAIASVGYSIYVTAKTPDIHVKKIKRNAPFLRIMSCLAFCITLFIFGFELVKIIVASYQESFSSYFSLWRVLRFTFALPCSLYFLFMSLPSKFKRKRIKISKSAWYVCSVGTILWAVFGLLSSYFYKQLTTMNVLKIWHLIVYLSIALFFLFEAKFEHINQSPRAYIFFGCLSFILSMSFSLTNLICLTVGTIPAYNSFSTTDLLCTTILGLYAFSRICAIPYTIKHVMQTSDVSMHSHSEHRRSHKGHSHKSSSEHKHNDNQL